MIIQARLYNGGCKLLWTCTNSYLNLAKKSHVAYVLCWIERDNVGIDGDHYNVELVTGERIKKMHLILLKV